MTSLLSHHPQAGFSDNMVNVGDDAPNFELFDQNKNVVTGGGYKGQKVVLAFFPAAFTGTCRKEMCTFQDSAAQLNDANAVILGICVDGPFTNKAFAEDMGVTFPILSDFDRSTCRAYGIAHDDFAGLAGYTASKRAVFIVDESGDVMWKWVADSPPEEPDYEAVLAALA